MPPTAEDRLQDILEAIDHIQARMAGKSIHDFEANLDLRLIVERLMQIVCEAAHKLPRDIKAAASDIDWKGINDFGNLLRHAYHDTKPEIVWNIVAAELPRLRAFAESQRRRFDR
jgi:uncharacterized protein with HEPN domain